MPNIDSSYNRVVAHSLRAHANIFSTRNSGNDVRIAAAEHLADAYFYSKRVWSPAAKLSLRVDTSQIHSDALQRIEWEQVWAAINHPQWEKSISNLRACMRGAHPHALLDKKAADEALNAHIEYIAKSVHPFTVQCSRACMVISLAAAIGGHVVAGQAVRALEYLYTFVLPHGVEQGLGV